MTPAEIARYIDHTLLKPDANEMQIRKLCDEAMTHKFASVCVNPLWVTLCSTLLAGSDVKTCAVVGFPLGANLSETKVAEARSVFERGASEIDMVFNIGALKSGDAKNIELVSNDIQMVRKAVPEAVLKVIIETCLLTDFEKCLACAIAKNSGADFVKTSTGFSSGGATLEDISLIRRFIGEKMGVKASGGIKDFETAKAMIEAGANRLGCSASVAIVSALA
ncbi:MAG: deoxyribose-phosphate aldolase [Candidatus Taylorbacteria bacterium]|nr:deoxyribose-phosphate aldolase [Candidatus Taylorbacteria bacterium]